MNHSTLILNKQAVEEGIVEEAEFAQCLSLFQTEVLLTECKAKTKNVALVPTSIAKAAAEAHGRSPRTVELLKGMGQLSRQWVQLEERDALAAENMIDPVLEDEIEQENPGIDVLLRIIIAGTRLRPRAAVEAGVYDFSDVPSNVWESCLGTVARRLQDLRDRGLCA